MDYMFLNYVKSIEISKINSQVLKTEKSVLKKYAKQKFIQHLLSICPGTSLREYNNHSGGRNDDIALNTCQSPILQMLRLLKGASIIAAHVVASPRFQTWSVSNSQTQSPASKRKGERETGWEERSRESILGANRPRAVGLVGEGSFNTRHAPSSKRSPALAVHWDVRA